MQGNCLTRKTLRAVFQSQSCSIIKHFNHYEKWVNIYNNVKQDGLENIHLLTKHL